MAKVKQKQQKEQNIKTVVKRKKKKGGGRPKGSPQMGGMPLSDEMFDDPKNIERLRELAANCLTIEQIAGCFGVARTTMYSMFDRRPYLREIIDQGKAESINRVANRLIEDANNGNTTAQIFYLKAQGGWRDRQEIIHSGLVKHEISLEAVKRIDQMTPEQRASRLEELRQLTAMDEIVDVELD